MFRDKVRNREKAVGMHVNFMDTAVPKIAGVLGFDFVWVDMEHRYLSLDQLQNHIMVLQGGIIFPMIRSKEEADRLIAATLYPPYGPRGFGPLNATDFGNRDVTACIESSRRGTAGKRHAAFHAP